MRFGGAAQRLSLFPLADVFHEALDVQWLSVRSANQVAIQGNPDYASVFASESALVPAYDSPIPQHLEKLLALTQLRPILKGRVGLGHELFHRSVTQHLRQGEVRNQSLSIHRSSINAFDRPVKYFLIVLDSLQARFLCCPL